MYVCSVHKYTYLKRYLGNIIISIPNLDPLESFNEHVRFEFNEPT